MTPDQTPEQVSDAQKFLEGLGLFPHQIEFLSPLLAARDAAHVRAFEKMDEQHKIACRQLDAKDREIAELRKESDRWMNMEMDQRKRAEQAEAAQDRAEKFAHDDRIEKENVQTALAAMTKLRDAEKSWAEAETLRANGNFESYECVKDKLSALLEPAAEEEVREALEFAEDSSLDYALYADETHREYYATLARALRAKTAALKEDEALLFRMTKDRDGWRDAAQKELDRANATGAKLSKAEAFKAWTHSYLDKKGVPATVQDEHLANGCRIGGRMDWVFAKLAALEKKS